MFLSRLPFLCQFILRCIFLSSLSQCPSPQVAPCARLYSWAPSLPPHSPHLLRLVHFLVSIFLPSPIEPTCTSLLWRCQCPSPCAPPPLQVLTGRSPKTLENLIFIPFFLSFLWSPFPFFHSMCAGAPLPRLERSPSKSIFPIYSFHVFPPNYGRHFSHVLLPPKSLSVLLRYSFNPCAQVATPQHPTACPPPPTPPPPPPPPPLLPFNPRLTFAAPNPPSPITTHKARPLAKG